MADQRYLKRGEWLRCEGTNYLLNSVILDCQYYLRNYNINMTIPVNASFQIKASGQYEPWRV
jgi:hypothetical protein